MIRLSIAAAAVILLVLAFNNQSDTSVETTVSQSNALSPFVTK